MNLFRRFFFKCTGCGFMLSLLGQADRTLDENMCPCCGESFDYASEEDRERYIMMLKIDLKGQEMLEG